MRTVYATLYFLIVFVIALKLPRKFVSFLEILTNKLKVLSRIVVKNRQKMIRILFYCVKFRQFKSN